MKWICKDQNSDELQVWYGFRLLSLRKESEVREFLEQCDDKRLQEEYHQWNFICQASWNAKDKRPIDPEGKDQTNAVSNLF